jgi:hypothetical protein
MKEDYRCQATVNSYGAPVHQHRCSSKVAVEINKKRLCGVHAKQEALAMMIKSGKAEKIIIPVTPPKDKFSFVEVAKDQGEDPDNS